MVNRTGTSSHGALRPKLIGCGSDQSSVETLDRERVAQLVLHRLVRQIVQRLKHPHLEDLHLVSRFAARRALALHLRAPQPALEQSQLQLHPEQLERHRRIDRHQRITMRVQPSIPVFTVEKSRLAHLEIPGFRADRAQTMNPILPG